MAVHRCSGGRSRLIVYVGNAVLLAGVVRVRWSADDRSAALSTQEALAVVAASRQTVKIVSIPYIFLFFE